MSSSTTASQEELKAHRVPLGWRDGCSAYVPIYLTLAVPVAHLCKSDKLLPFVPLNCLSCRLYYTHFISNYLNSCGTKILVTSNTPTSCREHAALRNSLLIPLNLCRKKNMYKYWECDHDRHVYEQLVVHFVAAQTY